jgi:hypothetical protein
MRRVREAEAPETPADMELEEGCLLCGGPLSLRVVGSTVGTYCRSCRWISRPQLHRHQGEVHLVHPSRMVA